jgi:hypothetical protein
MGGGKAAGSASGCQVGFRFNYLRRLMSGSPAKLIE